MAPRRLVTCLVTLCLVSTSLMAETPFGELPGETYEEYNNRRLREINEIRIEAGMPPLRGVAESGAEIQAALDASEEFRTRKLDIMPQPDKQGIDPKESAFLVKLLQGALSNKETGKFVPLPSKFDTIGQEHGAAPDDTLGFILQRAMQAEQTPEIEAIGVGTGAQTLPGTPPTTGELIMAELRVILENMFGKKEGPPPGTIGNPGEGVEDAADKA